MDGCDVPSGDSNPLDWKHGGQMSDNNEVTYAINPTTLRPLAPDSPQAKCTFQVSWFRDIFTVSLSLAAVPPTRTVAVSSKSS